jgi:tetratricopeptide (TPR) repeat protein
MIRTYFFIVFALSLFVTNTYGQSEKKAVREGNREFKRSEYMDSEISYRSALDINPTSFKGNFNLGGALYKQQKYADASKQFENLAESNLDPKDKAKVFHNLGNSLFKQENYAESVEAYKNALRFNPNDMETKYNLSQAQRMLIQQEQQQNDNSDGDGDNDKDDKKDGDDKREQEQDKNKDNENEQKNKDQQNQNQKEQEQQISPEDARRMLEAIQNNEQKIQDRVREEQARQAKVKVEKNW